jgi:DNA invertase Pin-like site-specific DNA recombinase
MTTATITSDYADVTVPDGYPVAIFERVSTDMTRQEIASQTRSIRDHLNAGSYRVERVFRIEASAFHGGHASELAEILEDVRAGRYFQVIAAMSSRFERRGWKVLLPYMLELDAVGGRLVAADDPTFGDMSTVMGAFGAVMDGEKNYKYSDDVRRNVNRTNALRDADNKFRGAVPGGYAVRCDACGTLGCKSSDHKGKSLVPHPLAAPVVIAAFTDSADGKSTPAIARTFKAANERHGTKLPSTPDGVAKLLRAEIYSTGNHPIKRHDGTVYTYRAPALVTPSQQAAAIAAMNSRRTGDNVSSRAIAKEDYSGALRCGACDAGGRMYRYMGGGKPLKDGTPTPRVRRYHCEACGKSVNGANADAAVEAKMQSDGSWWYELVTSDPNADRDRSIATVKSELRSLDMDSDDYDERHAELRASLKSLQGIPDQPIDSYAEHVTDDAGTWLTQGARWSLMTVAERRDVLTSGDVYAYVRASAGRTGAVEVTIERDES